MHLRRDIVNLQGTANRLDLLAHFYTQDIPTAMQKVQLVSGGREVILWAGLQGNIGIFAPFQGREDVDFFQITVAPATTPEAGLAAAAKLMPK